ncbi:orotidine-5'-phosphate decarboxylase [Candidatus Halobeggiatoa sp. HSG11]|nr:orotidine-5'-phosphate decarboxylase [Candidatus Halobeggiatoa sp. HSG11]
MTSPIIIALDFPKSESCLELVEKLENKRCRVKIGKELFTRSGPALVEKLVADGFEVFLDLKYHDIPNTVAKACSIAADLGVWMINVHALGGQNMMLAAREAVDKYTERPLLIAVSILTSLEQNDLASVGLQGTVEDNVLRLAKLANDCYLDGVVCSPLEITRLRNNLDKKFKLVTPGIRPFARADDQKRTMTPAQALQHGADYLVIGRPITTAPNPLQALLAIEQSIINSN